MNDPGFSKVYLGDGLYASFDGYQIILTAEDGIRVTNMVALEQGVLIRFEAWVKVLREHIRNTYHQEF